MGCRGVRGHFATPFRKRCAVKPSWRRNVIDDASFTIDRQDRDRDDLSWYIGHFFRLAGRAAANLPVINARAEDSFSYVAVLMSIDRSRIMPTTINQIA